MDPNETLKNLRKYASDTGGEFGEQFEALDEWLSKGGFLPADWQTGRHNGVSGTRSAFAKYYGEDDGPKYGG